MNLLTQNNDIVITDIDEADRKDSKKIVLNTIILLLYGKNIN